MKFRVLGPLEVDAGDGPIPLGGPKQRAVLANLVIRANQLVPADTLIDEIWGEEPPDQARHTLQTYVSNLRRTLGEDRLQGRSPGYILVLDPLDLDAARFDSLVRDAKQALPVAPTVAVMTFDDALALWRGPALADLADLAEQGSLVAEAARLDDLRLEAQEDRIEGLLAAGAQAVAIGELEALLAHNPLRENLWGLLMTALYREGRQAEALGAYQRAREILADELGIDPSPELARIHERVLKQDPGLDLRGEPLRGYRLLERIDDGPMGTVFRAIQPHVGRDVAVKVFYEHVASDPAFVGRFEAEAQAVAAHEHPHIVPIHDYWREPGRAYIVSRYLRGGSLRGVEERDGSLPKNRAVRIVEQIASALAFAHRHGIAHGNIGRSNVLLDAEANAYLADFRIAVGPSPAPQDDVRALARLAAELLARDMPRRLAGLVDRAEIGQDVPTAAAFAEEARLSLEPEAIRGPRPQDVRNPYKGLRAFTAAESRDFFGRGELTERLVARLNETGPGGRFLALVGPSGSGKSSVVRAGLIPAIRRGALDHAGGGSIVEMFPGPYPIDELAAALLRVAASPTPRLHNVIDRGSRGLLEAVDLVATDGADVVLVVDQLEELFTLTTNERERELFLESLRVATADPRSRLRVVVTLRADFYDRPLVFPRFGELLAARTEAVPPMTPDELEQAIREPAEQEGIRPEAGLVAETIADVAHQPGALPLLQYALTELFERRDDERLTLEAYREIGGVAGALSARAERTYEATDADGRRAIKQLFLRLVSLGEGRQDTRRRVARRELNDLDVDPAEVDAVLDTFGRHRFLTFDREPSTRESTVEIAHEALLSDWRRLRKWIDDAREDLRQDRRLAGAAAEWRGSDRDPSFLMKETRLQQLESWAETTDLAIGRPERMYLKASVDQRDREREEERERRKREVQIERRSRTRLRALVIVFAVAALVAGTLTIIATNQGERARHQARIANARELAAAAVANLEVDPERSLLLAMEAADETRTVDGSVLAEAEDALHQAVTSSRVVMTLPDAGGPVAWGGDGFLATESSEASAGIDVREAETGAVVRTIQAGAELTDLVFGADGRTLAATSEDGTLQVWDASSGIRLAVVTGEGPASGVSFDRERGVVAAAWPEKDLVQVLDLSTRIIERIRIRDADETSLSPDGDRVAIGQGRQVIVIDLRTGRRVFDPLVPSSGNSLRYEVGAVAWSPDGRSIATASTFLDIWDAATGRLHLSRFAGINSVAWSPDSTRLATGTSRGVHIWSLGAFDPVGELTLSATDTQIGVAQNVAFSPDGGRVMAAGDEGAAARIWDVGLGGDAEWANLPTVGYFGDVDFLPDGRHVIAAAPGGAVAVWDPVTGRAGGPIGPPIDAEYAFDLSADGRSIAFARSPTVTAWDVRTGDRLFTRRFPSSIERVDWSPDGKYLAAAGPGVTVLDRAGDVVTVLGGPRGSTSVARFSPDGREIAVGEYDAVRIWDWQRDEVVRSLPATGWDLAFDPTGTSIVTDGMEDGLPQVWDVATGTRRAVLRGASDDVLAVAFSPDGSTVATGGQDQMIRLFDAATGEQLLVLQGHRVGVRDLAFSPDGSKLASHSPTLIRIWALDIDDLLEIASQKVSRSLTDEECLQFLHVGRCPD